MHQIDFVPSPLLAIDVGGIIGLIVFLVTIFSWISQALGGGKNAKVPPRQRMGNPARPIPEQLQEGIELFKKMVADQQRLRQNPPAQNTPPAAEGFKKNNPPPIPSQRPKDRSTSEQQPIKASQRKKQSRKSNSSREQPFSGGSVGQRHLPVEADLRQHVTSDAQKYLNQNSVADQVRSDFQNSVNDEVTSHLGKDGTRKNITPGQAPLTDNSAQALRRLLKNRHTISQAILINEILQRPVGLRKK